MRHPDSGGLSARGRAQREKVRLQAAQMFEQKTRPEQIVGLRASTKSVKAAPSTNGTVVDGAAVAPETPPAPHAGGGDAPRRDLTLILRYHLDDTRMTDLARGDGISVSTEYEYRDEGIAVLAARRPSRHTHMIVDGTLVATDRIDTSGPTPGVDQWWSGKHKHHGGNIQVVPARRLADRGPPRSARARSTT
jgi:hypothetical protein